MADIKKSSSLEQQNAELYIADAVEGWLGFPVERNHKITFNDGVQIIPDLYSESEKVIGEIYAHIGTLKGNQPDKIASDILKMLLHEKVTGTTYRKLIVIVDEMVEKQLTGKSNLAESIRQFGVELMRIDLDADVRDSVIKAQIRQVMK